jgi:hypothetical protein
MKKLTSVKTLGQEMQQVDSCSLTDEVSEEVDEGYDELKRKPIKKSTLLNKKIVKKQRI